MQSMGENDDDLDGYRDYCSRRGGGGKRNRRGNTTQEKRQNGLRLRMRELPERRGVQQGATNKGRRKCIKSISCATATFAVRLWQSSFLRIW